MYTTNVANNDKITLAIAATDSKGNLAPERARLRVWETPTNGEKIRVYDSQALSAVPSFAASPSRPGRRGTLPINLAMVLDRSGSMNRSEQADMQDAALALWDFLRSGDQVEVVNVSRHAVTSDVRRAVFLVTDGENNRSEISLESLIGTAQDKRVPVFILGLADASDPSDLHAEELEMLARKTLNRGEKKMREREIKFPLPLFISVRVTV